MKMKVNGQLINLQVNPHKQSGVTYRNIDETRQQWTEASELKYTGKQGWL